MQAGSRRQSVADIQSGDSGNKQWFGYSRAVMLRHSPG